VSFFTLAKNTKWERRLSLGSLLTSNGLRDNAAYSILKDFNSNLRKFNTAFQVRLAFSPCGFSVSLLLNLVS